jgi:hypothetical protein
MTLSILRARYQLDLDDSALSRYRLTHAGEGSYCPEYRDGTVFASSEGPQADIVASQSSRR